MNDRTTLLGDLLRLPRRPPRRRPDHDWMYGGARPRLADIEAGAGVPADDLPTLTTLLTRPTTTEGLHLIVGPAGSGRSTLLLQVGRELARGGHPVYLHVPGSGGVTLDRVIGAARRPALTYLLIDDLDLYPEAEMMLYEIARAGARILVVGTVRAELPQAHDGDGLAELRPATLIDSGARQSLRPRVQGRQWGLQPHGDWRPRALAEAAASEAFLGLVLAGLAELPVPLGVLQASADSARVESWLRKHLAGSGGVLVFPPHSENCRDLLGSLQLSASQIEAALTLLLDHADGKEAIFAPRLLARLAVASETAEVARRQIARRGQATMQRAPADAVSLAWQLAWQVGALDASELSGANGYPPDTARRLRACFAAGQFEAAMELALDLTQDPWYGALGQYDVSLLQARRGEWELASAAAARANPALPQTAFLLALLAEKRQDHEAAVEYYKAATEDPTLAISAAYHLGQLHLGMGAPRTALRLFEAALQEDPLHPWPYGGAAVAHLQLGAVEAATAQSARAIRAGVPPVQARRTIAQAFLSVRAYGHAVAELERCVAEAPDDLEAWRDLAEAAHQGGDYTREQEALEQIIALSPGDVAAQVQRARATMDQGEARAAWEMLAALSEASLGTVASSLLTAEVAGRVNRPRDQRRAAEAALALGDTSGWALFWLGCSEAAVGGVADELFTRAASALHRNLEADLPARERARLWEAILVTAVSIHDDLAMEQAAASARREAQLCAATAAKIESVIAGHAVGAGAFQRQLEALREHGPEGLIWQPAPAESALISEPLAPPPAPQAPAASIEVEKPVVPELPVELEPEARAELEPEPVAAKELMLEAKPEPVVVAEPEAAAQPEPLAEPEREPVREVVAVVMSPRGPRVLSGGDSIPFTAVVQYDNGTTEDVTTQVSWSWTGDRQAGAVSAAGLFVAGEGFGAGRVVAAYGDFTAESEAITVRSAAFLALSPPEPAVLAAGDTIQFAAALQYDDGTTEDVTARAAWRWSGDAGAGTVNEAGLFTAGEGFGAGRVTATCGEFAAESEEITVRNVVALTLMPPEATVLSAGRTAQFTAVLQYDDGTSEDVTTQARWGWSGDGQVGVVSPAGLFTAGAGFGAGRVTATYGEFATESEVLTVRNVTVLALTPSEPVSLSAGETIQFTAVLRYDDGTGENVTDRATWTWSGPAEAGVLSATGLFTAGEGFGAGRVTAAYGDFTVESGVLTVRNISLLALTPTKAAVLSAGETIQFAATLQYNDGATEDVTARAVWSWSGDERAGAMTEAGLFTAGDGFGAGQVTATWGDFAASSEELLIRNVTFLSLTPSGPTILSAGASVQFAAVLQYNDGSSRDVTGQVVWKWTGEAQAGAIEPTGLFTAGDGFGTGRVTATCGDFTAESEDVTIHNVAALLLSPVEELNLQPDDRVQFAATIQYDDGACEDVTGQATWTWTGYEHSGLIGEGGLFVAGEEAGVGQVEAVWGDWRASSATVTVEGVSNLAVLPSAELRVELGQTQRFAALMRGADDAWANVPGGVEWSWTGPPESGRVDAGGMFTAGPEPGEGIIIATYQGRRARSGLVLTRPAAQLVVLPAEPVVLSGGQAVQCRAVLRYADGTEEDVSDRAVWRWEGDEGAGELAPGGLFTATEVCASGQLAAAFEGLEASSETIGIYTIECLIVLPSAELYLSPGETQRFSASFRYGDGTLGDATEKVEWAWTGPPDTGTITPDGVLTAGSVVGEGLVTARFGGYSDQSGRVCIRGVTRLVLSSDGDGDLWQGDSRQFTLVAEYSDGHTEDVTAEATWSWAARGGESEVFRRGLFTHSGRWCGPVTVTATYREQMASSGTIDLRNLVTLRLFPPEELVLGPGETKQFHLYAVCEPEKAARTGVLGGLFQRGAKAKEELIEITDQAQWHWTGDPAAGSVSDHGLFTVGESYDVGRITATFRNLRVHSSAITVTAPVSAESAPRPVDAQALRERLARVISEARAEVGEQQPRS